MARIYGLSGRITGRKGDAVFAVRSGEQIVRQYNPIVRNPQTSGQTAQRAKMKLASQLSAVFGPYLAIRPDGAKSARNIFTSKIMPEITYAEETATMNLEKVILTDSALYAGPVQLNQVQGETPQYMMFDDCSQRFDKVAYVLAVITADSSIVVIDSQVCSVAGNDGHFTCDCGAHLDSYATGKYFLYAYGMKANSAKAKAKIDEIYGDSVSGSAKLGTDSTALASDVTFSETTHQEGTIEA